MADVIYVTARPVWLPSGFSSPVSQDLDQVVDICGCDSVDVVIQTYKFAGTASPVVNVNLLGSLQRTQDDGSWALNPIGTIQVSGEGLVRGKIGDLSGASLCARYLRWQLSIATAGSTITGLAIDIVYFCRPGVADRGGRWTHEEIVRGSVPEIGARAGASPVLSHARSANIR
jgi:hypothetical protein